MNRPSKQAIAEVSSMSGGRAIKVFYVPTEMDHTVRHNSTSRSSTFQDQPYTITLHRA